MAFSGGVFSLIAGNPVTTNTTISSTWANDTLTDIATNGLTLCVLKDGSQTITANIPMSGFKFTGLGAGSAAGDSLRYEQGLQSIMTTTGDFVYASAANTASRLPAKADVAAHATTSNIWVAREIVLTGSAVTFTDIADAPYVGAVAWVKQQAANVWTNGAVFNVQGNASYTAAADDWVRVYATTVSTFEVTVFRADGANVAPAPTIQVFTSSDTYTKPAGVRAVRVTVVGGGGGSGAANSGASEANAGAGGGGGGASIKVIAGATVGSTETVTVGAGGTAGTAAGAAAGAGGTSSFGAHASATGGAAGATGVSGTSVTVVAAGSAGGVGSGGNVNLTGGNGSAAIRLSGASSVGGNGGNSILGGGGYGAASNTTGIAGGVYGGGAGGAASENNNDRDGNAGAAGIVIVEEFY